MDILLDEETVTQPQLVKILRRVNKYKKFGFYVEVEELPKGKLEKVARFHVKLYGPKLVWKRKTVWELANAN